MLAAIRTSLLDDTVDLLPQPPTDAEARSYLSTPQHRWFMVAQAVASIGVAVSVTGLALRSYWTLPILLLVAALLVEQGFGLYSSTRRRRLTWDQHEALIRSWAPERYPSVDVFLPSAGESLDVLANTYRWVARLRWKGDLRVHVLDDAGRAEVRALAGRHGFGYLARPGSQFKKAGNLQYAFARTDGDVITILDADFVPRADYLEHLVPYLDDTSVGIVQSPQYFETSRRMSWLQRCAGTTQELFYRFVQSSRDSVGAAICVGTSAVYSRAALDMVGGFPQIDHSEDIYTGVELSRVGRTVRYVPVVLTCGEAPSDLDAFISQQYRWCEGSLSLLGARGFHEATTLSRRQRWCFWAGFLYYLTTALAAVAGPAMLLLMLVAYPDQVSSLHALALVPGLLCWLVVFPLLSVTGWRWETLRVQLVYSFTHLVCLADLLRGRLAEWIPTGVLDRQGPSVPIGLRVRRFMAGYLIVSQTVAVGATVAGLLTYGPAAFGATAALVALGLYVAAPVCVLAVRTRRAGRASDRSAATGLDAELDGLLLGSTGMDVAR